MALGRVNPSDNTETFCMTVLALKSSRRANGVSAIHGTVSRLMWNCLWPDRPESEVPIGHITNGVHVLSWLAPQMHQLFQTRLGEDWATRMVHPDVWEKVADIDDAELWETHQTLKMRLIRLCPAAPVRYRRSVWDTKDIPEQDRAYPGSGCADHRLSPAGLPPTRRGDLILSQPERLAKLIE